MSACNSDHRRRLATWNNCGQDVERIVLLPVDRLILQRLYELVYDHKKHNAGGWSNPVYPVVTGEGVVDDAWGQRANGI